MPVQHDRALALRERNRTALVTSEVSNFQPQVSFFVKSAV